MLNVSGFIPTRVPLNDFPSIVNTTTDFSWLPEPERWRCVDRATAEAFFSLHMFEEGKIYFGLWEQGLGRAIRADGKRKWKTMAYQMTDWNHGFKRKCDY